VFFLHNQVVFNLVNCCLSCSATYRCSDSPQLPPVAILRLRLWRLGRMDREKRLNAFGGRCRSDSPWAAEGRRSSRAGGNAEDIHGGEREGGWQ
jgi:hypothetical protein